MSSIYWATIESAEVNGGRLDGSPVLFVSLHADGWKEKLAFKMADDIHQRNWMTSFTASGGSSGSSLLIRNIYFLKRFLYCVEPSLGDLEREVLLDSKTLIGRTLWVRVASQAEQVASPRVVSGLTFLHPDEVGDLTKLAHGVPRTMEEK